MIIEVKNLKKVFRVKKSTNMLRDIFYPKHKIVTAVEGITISIEKGESVAVLGPNGAGKTTTMKMLSGLIYPTSGEIKVLGYFPFDRKREFLKRIGLVMGNKTGLEWDLTPFQNFELIRKIYAISQDQYGKRLRELTTLLSVTDLLDTQVRKLSLGERMKMELIASILHNPEVLFLDEPTIGLDILSKQKVREFLRQIQKKSEITLLLTSHDMADVEKVCDRVVVINKGKKVYDDALPVLLSKYSQKRYVELYFKNIPEKEELKYLGKEIERGESSVVLEVESAKLPSLLSKATSDFKLMDIDILSVPLDEIIADIFRKSEADTL